MALSWLNEVRTATTENITLTGIPEIDGVALVAGDRVLVKDQSTPSENGVYVCQGLIRWGRATDFATGTASVTPELTVRVSEGLVNAHTQWFLANQGAINVGTTSLSFVRVAPVANTSTPVWNGSTIATLQGLAGGGSRKGMPYSSTAIMRLAMGVVGVFISRGRLLR